MQQYVSEKILKSAAYYYAFAMLVMGVLFCVFAVRQRTVFVSDYDQYGINFITGIFAVAGLLYIVGISKYVKKMNIWLAYLLGYVFFAFTFASAAEVAGEYTTSYIFIAHNILVAIAATLYGPVISMIVVSAIAIIFVLALMGSAPPTPLGINGDALSTAFRVLSIAVLLVWFKRRYHTGDSSSKENYVGNYLVNNDIVKLLTDSIGDGIIIIDKNANIKSANPAVLRLLGQNQKDILDLDYKSVLKFLLPNREAIPQEDDPIAKALREQATGNHELILVLRNGQELFVDINVSVITNPHTREQYGGVVILRDVSKKKQEETARSEFISTASHEMRTPVAAIEGYLGLALNNKVSTIDDRARGYLEKAHASTQSLGKLFQDLLLSARAEDGRLISHPQVLDMGKYLEQLVESLQFAAQKKGLLMDFIIGTGGDQQADVMNGKVVKPLYYTMVDPDRMREVIINLFDNAVKYTETGKVSIGLTGNNEVVQLFVRDTGAGIPAADIGHLFQKFYRVDNSATRTIGGTGLGLFISRKIVELYRGRIWVESELGKGSTFYINLPRLSSQKASELLRDEEARNINASPLDNTANMVQ